MNASSCASHRHTLLVWLCVDILSASFATCERDAVSETDAFGPSRSTDQQHDELAAGRRTDNLELTIDLFNALDRVNVTGYVGVITSPLFGEPTAARNPRTAQPSLRYRF
jgi:hypothetical protein